MALPLIGAAVGAGFNFVSSLINGANQRSAAQRAADRQAQEAHKTRMHNMREVRRGEKRAENYRRADEKRAVAMAKDAEKRNEQYLISAENRADQRSDPATIRAKMENAGFNPLGAAGLGAPAAPLGSTPSIATGTSGLGSSSSFDNGSIGAGIGPILAQAYGQLPMVGGIIQNGFELHQAQIDAANAQKAALEMENARLAKMAQTFTLNAPVPGMYGPANSGRSTNYGQPVSDPVDGDTPYYEQTTPDGYTGFRFMGVDIEPNPNSTDAANLGDRYGDVVEDVGGVGVLFNDLWHTFKPEPLEKIPRKRVLIQPPNPTEYYGKAPGWR